MPVSSTDFDLIVIGAGINGAGVARDAAMRGLKVLLIDKGDFGSGTSSWSTRLIHGGLRYLEHGEFSLVRESLRERGTLLTIAPHLVKPLRILVPIYANRRRGPWTIRAGMITYDLLSFDKKLPAHRAMSAEEALQASPGLNAEGLRAAVVYYDAQVEFAERLVLENVLSAHENNAELLSYSQVTDLIVEGGQTRGIKFIDLLTSETKAATARLVVNASGPWVDELLAQSGVSSERLIGGTKGSHIVVGPFPGAPENAVYVEAEMDHRPIFIIPWNGNYLIGTTDIRFSGSLDRVDIDDGEITYLLEEANTLIPVAGLNRASILFTYSGVRPLAFTADDDEQGITRRHFVREHPNVSGLISLVGGKLTTYRSLAEQTVDLCLRRLGKSFESCATATTPLPGAKGESQTFSREVDRLSRLNTKRLHRIYGARAVQLLDLVGEHPKLMEIFDPETEAIAAEVVFAFRNEFAKTLADCLLRRSMVGLNSTCGLNAVEAAANIGQEYLGWSPERVLAEIDNYRDYVERFHPSWSSGFGGE